MAATPSTMVPLGTLAPDFLLRDPKNDENLRYDDVAGDKGTLVMFICNHCPFVKLVADELARLGRDYQQKGIGLVAISSNDAENYPDDSPAMMVREAEVRGYTFPYLYDETQDVARAYDAVCTPDFFVFDEKKALVYRGQLDDARPGNGRPVTGADIRRALDAVLAGEKVDSEQIPSVGCNIKWRS